MRHVDEGVLHAWLDGALDMVADAGGLPAGETVATVEAHLRTCAHCQALLERERILRGEAGLILQDTATAPVDVPPFERIAAGVGAGGAGLAGPETRRGRSRRGLTLAWAASVLLAVGAGWWGSVVWQDGAGAPDASMARDMAAEATRADPAAAPSPTLGDMADATTEPVEPDAPATGSAPTVAASAAPLPPVADIMSEPARADVLAIAQAAAQRDSQPAPSPAPQQSPRPAQQQASLPAVPAAPPPVALPVPLGEVAAMTRNAVVTAQDVVVTADPGVPGIMSFAPVTLASAAGRDARAPQAMLQAAPPAGRLAGRGASSIAVDAAEATAVQRTPLPMVTFSEAVAAARAGALHWQPAPPAAVGTVLVLQGATVDGVDMAALPDGSLMTRVRHRLADGAAVELLQWQDPAEPRARVAPVDGAAPALFLNAGPTFDGRHQVMLRAPALGAFIMVSADMAADTLVRLADALVPASR